MQHEDYIRLAVQALDYSYSPYSHFRVGACLVDENGNYFQGANFENASLGATICAERCAVVKAVSEGHTDFVRIAVWGDSRGYCMPCGSCRQVLSEFSADLRVIAARGDGSFVAFPLSELLPHTFGF